VTAAAVAMAGITGEAARQRGCCFGPPEAGALLAFHGSRWRIWGEEGTTVDLTHRDPTETYTVACWGPGSQRLSLGCASGRVQVWDPNSGELAGPVAEAFHAIAQGADCAVSTLAPSQPHRAVVFAGCYALPEIVELSVLDGATRRTFKAGKAGIRQLAAFGDVAAEWLLSAGAGSALKLWHLEDAQADRKPQVHAKLAGPGNTPTCLDVYCGGGHVLAACADASMQLDVFSCSADAGEAGRTKDAPQPAAFVLSSHERVQSARFVRPADAADAKARMSVVGFGASVVAIWSFAIGLGSVPAKAPKTVAAAFVVLAEDLGARVLCARPAAASAPIVVAFGPASKPSFAKVGPPATEGGSAVIEPCGEKAEEEPKARLPGAKPSRAEREAAAAAAKAEEPTVLGPLETAVPQRQQRRKRPVEEAGAAGEDEAAAKRAAALPTGRQAGSGLSLAPVMRQALRSKDSPAIWKLVATTGDRQVMDSTVTQLSGAEAFDLLQECGRRILEHPQDGKVLSAWIQRLLLSHCAFFTAQPVLQQALRPLHDVFQERCSTYRTLALLRGRLRLARDCGKQLLTTQKESETAPAPLLEYVEGDSDLGEEGSSDGEGGDGEESVEGLYSDDDLEDEFLDFADD